MIEITEREQKLLDILNVLINVNTIESIFTNHEIQLRKHEAELRIWRRDAYKNAGLTMEWQDKVLHMLEDEFGQVYRKIDEKTEKEVEE